MRKAIMIAIQPKWLKMIIEGTKKFEFRNYPIEKGMKVYLYESLGDRKPKHLWESYPLYVEHRWTKNEYVDEVSDYVTEGRGTVVAEFVVKDCRDDFQNVYRNQEYQEKYIEGLNELGYTNQKYAIEITDLIVYDEEWLEMNKPYTGILDDYGNKLLNAPTSPIPVTEFVGWNKIKNFEKIHPTYKEGWESNIEYGKGINGEQYETVSNYNFPKEELCALRKPPQSRVYVVERE